MRYLLLKLAVLAMVGCEAQRPPDAADVPKPAAGDAVVSLCGPDEPGKKLVFFGRILDYQGRTLAKAAVDALQADVEGLYTPKGATSRVPRLRGVAVTGEDGRYCFATVWPGAYPDGSRPAHIHVGVLAHEHRVRFVTFSSEGDPTLTDQKRKDAAKDPEVRIVKPVRGSDGVWRFEFDIRLEAA